MSSTVNCYFRSERAEAWQKEDGKGDKQNKTLTDPILPNGVLIKFTVEATCNGMKADVVAEEYYFTPSPFVDEKGYRPNINNAQAPRFITTLPGPQDSKSVFSLGPSRGIKNARVTAKAYHPQCGTWDASSTANFSMADLVNGDPNFLQGARVKSHEVTEDLRFSFSDHGYAGFRTQVKKTFYQQGFIGMIELWKGYQQFRLEEWPVDKWESVIDFDEYVLDIPRDGHDDYINQKANVYPNVEKLLVFEDSPSMSIKGLIDNQRTKSVVAVRQRANLQFYFFFNPSRSDDPSKDLDTMWYPLGSGIECDINGQAVWDENEGDRRTQKAWKVEDLTPPSMKALDPKFPVWDKNVL